MASIQRSSSSSQDAFDWEALLSRAYAINWEAVAYTVILLLALFTRFWDLGARVMSHDESLHTYYSWRLYDAGDFSHTPLMHGPLLFHATAFFYFLFGDGDFSARIYTALLGVGIVMFPLLFRRWLGRTGALLAAVGLLISPMMLYYSRYIRHDIPTIFYMLVMLYGFMQYMESRRYNRHPGWLVLSAGAMLLMLASKEVAFIYIAILGSFFTFYWIMRLLQHSPLRHRSYHGEAAWQPAQWQILLGHVLLLGLALLLGFLFGELLFYWQYAELSWVWIALVLGVVVLMRLLVYTWERLTQALASAHSRDILRVALAAAAFLGLLLLLLGLYQFDQKSQAIDVAQSLDALALAQPNAPDLDALAGQRALAGVLGGLGALLFVGGLLTPLMLFLLESDPDPQQRRHSLYQGLEALGMVTLVLLFLLLLKFITTDSFSNLLDRSPLSPHSSLDLVVILFFYGCLALSGLLRSFLAGEPRAGAAQLLTEGLARPKSAVMLIMLGLLLGSSLALHVITVLDIVKPAQVFQVIEPATDPETGAVLPQIDAETGESIIPQVETRVNTRLGNAWLLWIGLPAVGLILLVLLAALLKTPRGLPVSWADILLVLLVASLACGVMVYAERGSHVQAEEESTAEVEPSAIDPNAPETSVENSRYDRRWVIRPTLLMLLLGGLVILSRLFLPHLWAFLNREPIFGILILMGSLIFPWLSAYPLFQAGYVLDQAPLPRETILASFWVTGSFLFLSAAVGLSWNWRKWIFAVTAFMALFLFFFTTVFTNGAGVGTGMVGSLGYWLEQQEVRRGSQPQYYYTLLQVPVYEYLPLLMASMAGVFGVFQVFGWRSRSRRLDAEIAAQRAAEAELLAAEASLQDVPIQDAPTDPMLPELDDDDPIRRTTAPLDMDRVMAQQPPLSAMQASALPAASSPAAGTGPLYPVITPDWARPYNHQEELAQRANLHEWLGGVPFLPLLGYWALTIFLGLTYAGEKMPWLTTHITVPLIFIGAWFLGRVMERVHWDALRRGGWLLLFVLTPVFLVALEKVFSPLWGGAQPFQGMQQAELQSSFAWLAGLGVLLAVSYGIVRLGVQLGLAQTRRLLLLGMALLLAFLTLRTAMMAAFQNHDLATEYLVYAHSGPAVKTTLREIDYIAERTNQGHNLRVAYDDESSWPMTWYLRDYNTAYFAGEADALRNNPGVLEGAQVVIVGAKKNAAVQEILGDEFYRFDYIRLWWPMQEYFNLSYDRVANLFQDEANQPAAELYRAGMWDIWWNRDYNTYGQAQCVENRSFQCGQEADVAQCYQRIENECAADQRYSLQNWPVSDGMYVYINKEIAEQIWDAGLGGESVANRKPLDAVTQLYQEIAPLASIGQGYSLNGPRGLAVGPDGNIYVADTGNSRVISFSPDGELVTTFGVPISSASSGLGALNQPWGLDVATDGRTYVADTWNHRVQVFSAEGMPLTMWGTFGKAEENPSDPFILYGPRDLVIGLDGNIYVADTGGKRIRMYSPEGEWLRDIGSPGSALGQLEEPVGLAVHPVTGNLFVADSWNRRVQEFTAEGIALNAFEVPMWYDLRSSADRPYLAISPDGRYLALTDMTGEGRNDGPRVVVFDVGGVAQLSFNAPINDVDLSLSRVQNVAGLDFGSDGSLYVLDAETHRVLRFSPLPLDAAALPPGEGQSAAPPDGEQPPALAEDVGNPIQAAPDLPFSLDDAAATEDTAPDPASVDAGLEPTPELTPEPTEEAAGA